MKDRGGEETKIRDCARDVERARERDRFAVVATFETREVVEVLFDEIGELQQNARALFRGCFAPRRKCILRRRDRGIDVGAIAVGNLRDDVSGRGLDVIEIRAARGSDEFAADEISEAH